MRNVIRCLAAGLLVGGLVSLLATAGALLTAAGKGRGVGELGRVGCIGGGAAPKRLAKINGSVVQRMWRSPRERDRVRRQERIIGDIGES